MIDEIAYIWFNSPKPIRAYLSYIYGDSFDLTKDGFTISGKRGEGVVSKLVEMEARGIEILEMGEYTKLAKDDLQFYCRNLVYWEDDFDLYIDYCGSIESSDIVAMDVGGFQGISARIFSQYLNLDKLIVVEPLESNIEVIEKNLNLSNNLQVEVWEKMVGKTTGQETISSNSSKDSPSFGLDSGQVQIKADSLSWSDLLDKAEAKNVDFIKVDIEGAEAGLSGINPKDLQKIDWWLIETHGEEVRSEIEKAFIGAGFKCESLRHSPNDSSDTDLIELKKKSE